MALPKDFDSHAPTEPRQLRRFFHIVPPRPDTVVDRIRQNATPALACKAALVFFLMTAAPVGLTYALSYNDTGKQNMRIEPRVAPSKSGPTSADDCSAFSSGDPWFEECMRQREALNQRMTP